MGAENLDTANFILNAIQVGGLVGFMSVSIIGFVKGWVYPGGVVDELRSQVKELTATLRINGEGVDKLADAWEQRNKLEADKVRDDLLIERLKREGK